MTSSSSTPSAQLLPSLVFNELEKGFTNKEIAVRIIHSWEARNPKKGCLLMGLELLLIDQKSTVIQAFIVANRMGCYKGNLKSGVVYKIKNFLVINNKANYRVSPHKFLIQFTHQTKLNEIVDAGESIERQKFSIRSFKDFEEVVDMNENLYDTIGKLVLINDDELDNSNVQSGVTKSRIQVHLQLRDAQVVRLTLWDNVAVNFRKRLIESPEKPIVLLATAVNPRTVKGMFCLSSTSSTRIFLDNDVDLTTEYLTWLDKEGNISDVVTSEVIKSEPVTIDELIQFVENETPQIATFSCIATIVDISAHRGWHYIGCSLCGHKLEREDTTLVCNNNKCKVKIAVGVVRFRVELSVCDNNNVATFVIFESHAAKLTGMKAAEILETSMKDDDNGVIDNNTSLPQCLLDIVGHTYNFQVKITPYNFTATRQTITVARIIDEITDGDKTLQEETEETGVPNQSDNKKVETSGVAQLDAASDDDDTVGCNHKDKRSRHK